MRCRNNLIKGILLLFFAASFSNDLLSSALLRSSSSIRKGISQLHDTVALYRAVEEDNVDELRRLLEKSMESNDVQPSKNPSGETLLHVSARKGKVAVLRHLMASYPLLLFSKVDDSEDTALHLAAIHGQTACIESFIADSESSFLIASKNREGDIPLFQALKNQYKESVEKLLIGSKDLGLLTVHNKKGECVLHCAVLSHDVECFQLVIDHCRQAHTDQNNILNQQDNEGNTALHLATALPKCIHRAEFIRLLLEAKVDTEIKNKAGKCALELETNKTPRSNSIPVCSDSQESASEEASDGPNKPEGFLTDSPRAIHRKSLGLTRLALDAIGQPSFGFVAETDDSFRSCPGTPKLRLSGQMKRSSMEVTGAMKRSSMEVKGYESPRSSPRLAERKSALLNEKILFVEKPETPRMDSACTSAANSDSEEAEETFEELELRDTNGHTPLINAALSGDTARLKYLISRGVNCNVTENRFGYTALHAAVLSACRLRVCIEEYKDWSKKREYEKQQDACLECMSDLIEAGADVNALSSGHHYSNSIDDEEAESQCTPLYLASQVGHLRCIQILLKHNADFTLKSTHNITPLSLVIEGGYLGSARLLLAQGADPAQSFGIDDDENLLDKYFLAGDFEIVDFLKNKGAYKKSEASVAEKSPRPGSNGKGSGFFSSFFGFRK